MSGRAQPFPFRAGAIDVGSNAIRFLAAELTAPGEYRVLEQGREAVRLGPEVFRSGRLAADAIDAAVAAIAGFARRLDALEVSARRAVATSATRESANGAELVEGVRREAGLELEVIGGAEEARLGWRGVRAQPGFARGRWLVVDLGGGSVEVSLAGSDGIEWSESRPMGAVRLLDELAASRGEPERFERLLDDSVAALGIGAVAERWAPAGLVATGGNVEALARLAGRKPVRGRPAVLPLKALRATIATLAALSVPQRVSELGLRPDRADVVLPAAMVYARLAAAAGAREIHVPAVGLRDGIVVDLAG